MKVIVAPDSFKGSLSSREASAAIALGVLDAVPDAEVVRIPVADGGEGTVEALVEGLGGRYVSAVVHGPLGEEVAARYGIVGGFDGVGGGVCESCGVGGEGCCAVIESAAAIGLPLVPSELRNPMKTSSFGLGEMIADALGRGCRRFIIGLGGTSTNDGGLGMLSALGWRFFDGEGVEIGQRLDRGAAEGGPGSGAASTECGPGNGAAEGSSGSSAAEGTRFLCGEDLARVAHIDKNGVIPELRLAKFTVACDVATLFADAPAVFGPQKGATPEMVLELTAGMRHFAEVVPKFLQSGGSHFAWDGTDRADFTGVGDNQSSFTEIPGTGSAGGLGGAFAAFLDADLRPGIDIVLDAVGFDSALEGADVIITGEGRIDSQTALGKTPFGILRRAGNIPVIAFCGSCSYEDPQPATGLSRFSAIIPITPPEMPLAEAMKPDTAAANLRTAVRDWFQMRNEAGTELTEY